jgi:hypothetical protein
MLTENEINIQISRVRKWIWLEFWINASLLTFLWFMTGGCYEKIDTPTGPRILLNGTAAIFLIVIVSGIIHTRVSYVKIELLETIKRTFNLPKT